MHFPARRHAVAFFHRRGQILKHQPGGFFRQRVGKVAGVRRDPRLQRVGQHVHAGVGRNLRRHADHQIRVKDRHIGIERIVEQRILDAFIRVANHADAGHFRTGTAGGWYRHAGFDIDAALLAKPDDGFRRVHRRSAAEADDHLRLQGLHLRNALYHGVDSGVRGYLAKDANAVICGQRLTQGFQQRRARKKAIADNPDVLVGKALEHRQATLTAVQPRL